MNRILLLDNEKKVPYSSFEEIDPNCSSGLIAKVNKNGEVIAIKIFFRYDLEKLESEYECLTILKTKKCKNIVKFREAYKYELKSLMKTEGFNTNKALREYYSANDLSSIYVFEFDYYDGDNLENIVYKDSFYNKYNIHIIIVELISALKLCHNNMIVHNDLSSKNVFFDLDNRLTILLDFGNAEVKNSSCDLLYKKDINMLGVVLFYLISKKNDGFFLNYTISEKYKKIFDELDNIDSSYTELIRKCLTESCCSKSAIEHIYSMITSLD